MDVVRQIYESLPETIDMPDSLKNRPVEVILLPLDEAPVRLDKRRKKRKSPYEFLGVWKGEPLSRPEQGEYETREPLG
jgi:5-enolpyruvylshikimate-3-phosphate synthase